MKHPSRGRTAPPTKGDIRRYYIELRAAAEAGDIAAQVALIALGEGRPLTLTVGMLQAGQAHA